MTGWGRRSKKRGLAEGTRGPGSPDAAEGDVAGRGTDLPGGRLQVVAQQADDHRPADDRARSGVRRFLGVWCRGAPRHTARGRRIRPGTLDGLARVGGGEAVGYEAFERGMRAADHTSGGARSPARALDQVEGRAVLASPRPAGRTGVEGAPLHGSHRVGPT
jgi:hypothetical protein